MRGYMAEQGIRETWATAERLLVCIGPSRTAGRLVRATRRMAARLHADWFAAARRDARRPAAQPQPTARSILRALELAEQLGGRAVTLSGQSVADEILAYARAHNVTRIVVGKPERRALARAASGVAAGRAGPAERRRSRCSRSPARRTPSSRARRCRGRPPGASTRRPRPSSSCPTAIGLRPARGRTELATIDAAMLYLLAVVVVASAVPPGSRGRSPRCSASRCSTSSSSRPYYTFSVTRRAVRAHLRRDAGGRARDGQPDRRGSATRPRPPASGSGAPRRCTR